MLVLIYKDHKNIEVTEEYESLDHMYKSIENDLVNHNSIFCSIEHFYSLKDLVNFLSEMTTELDDFCDILSNYKKIIGDESFPLSIFIKENEGYCAEMNSDDFKNYLFELYNNTYFRNHKFVGIEENIIKYEELSDSKKSKIVEKITKRHSSLVADYELEKDDIKSSINDEYFFKNGNPVKENYYFGPYNTSFHNFEYYDWKTTLES